MDATDRERKKQWKDQERTAARAAFPLSDDLMRSLFETVAESVAEQGCDHTLRYTEQWLSGHPQSRAAVIAWLKENGGFCDCEVGANAVAHWEQTR
jgi:hypothetical protein